MSQDAIARIFAEQAAKGRAAIPAVPPPSSPPQVSPFGLQGSTFTKLPIDVLTDFPDQPFRPYTPEQLEQLQESIRHAGILTPLIVRRLGDKYQILSGHNRRTAARMAGYETIPCIVREMDDDQAVITVVETNLRQREKLLPSEKAFAYKLKLEALNHQGETSGQIGQKWSRDSLAEESNDSSRQIQRYIRLTYLEKTLLDAVDGERLGFGVGVTLSYLSTNSQVAVYHFFTGRKHRIDQRLADQLRALPEEELTPERLEEFLSPQDKRPRRVSVSMKPLRRYFPPEASPKEIEKEILKIVSDYFERRQKSGAEEG